MGSQTVRGLVLRGKYRRHTARWLRRRGVIANVAAGVVVTALASVVSVFGGVPANAAEPFTIADVCSSGGPVSVGADGAEVINLDAVPAGTSVVTVGEGGSCEGNNVLSSVRFAGNENGAVKTLIIADSAFEQASNTSDDPLTLKSLTFPDNITNLQIGSYAFEQANAGGSTVLAAITFPETLTTLSIGDNAFAQFSNGSGTTSLKSVTFPDNILNLQIGLQGFYQDAAGGSSSLASVVFPQSIDDLNVDRFAFAQMTTASAALAQVVFPETAGTVTIGDSAFQQHGVAGTALGNLTFPEVTGALTVGDSAFFQWAADSTGQPGSTITFGSASAISIGLAAFEQFAGGGNNSVADVTFTGPVASLSVGASAFEQYAIGGSNALARVTFGDRLENIQIGSRAFAQDAHDGGEPTLDQVVFGGGITSLTIGDNAFQQAADTPDVTVLVDLQFNTASAPGSTAGSVSIAATAVPSSTIWSWWGPDHVTTDDAWAGTVTGDTSSHLLYGSWPVTYDLAGGHAAEAGQTAFAPQLVRVDYSHGLDQAVASVTLPAVSPVASGLTFTGWANSAALGRRPLVATDTVAITGPTVFTALWKTPVATPTTGSSPEQASTAPASESVEVLSNTTAASPIWLAVVGVGLLLVGITLSTAIILRRKAQKTNR